ncbi:hypothetical protein EFU43_18375 [Vibrio cholerae]|nr:hypothetical protein [Vibrio cholerae]
MSQNDCIGKTLKPWPILVDHYKLTPQTASESYIKVQAAERIMDDLGIDFEPVIFPNEVKNLLIPYGVIS